MLQANRCLAAPLILAAIVVGATHAQAQGQTPSVSPVQTVALPSYRINPGDTLQITVLDKPSLCKTFSVPPDGKISYPYLGEISVAGMTLSQLNRRLTTGLSKELINPQVTVDVPNLRQYEVRTIGAVRTPGTHVMRDNYRLLDLIADSGGLSVSKPEYATAKLVQQGGAQVVDIDLTSLMTTASPVQNVVLSPGDLLLITEIEATRVSAQVTGQVAKPNNVVVPKDGSFSTVIASVGGFTPQAATTHVTLIRSGQTYNVDLHEVTESGKVVMTDDKGTPVLNPRVEAGDTIIVGVNKLTFSVLGAVGRQGRAEFPEDQKVTVLSALTLAGGPSGDADLKKAMVVTPVTGEQPKYQPVNLEELLRGDQGKKDKNKVAARDIQLQPGDMLFVPSKPGAKHRFSVGEALSLVPTIGWLTRF